MFPSSNYNDSNPLELLIKKSSFLYDQSLTTKQDDLSFLTFASPFFDENEFPLNHIFSHDQIMSTNDHIGTTNPNPSKKEKAVMRCSIDQMIPNGVVQPKKRNLGAVPRKRTGKKDRHSKICTAQGIRDRRMRLSLQVARKFFDLQDLLGYDKASKTIEWLFTKSRKAIKELIKELPQHNTYHISTSEPKNGTFLSESEGYSGIDENSNLLQFRTNPHEKYEAQSPKTASKKPLVDMKLSRKKARARARRRTMEKMMMKWCRSNNPSDDLVEFGTLKNNFFESVVQEGFFQSEEDLLSLHKKSADDVGTIEKLIEGSSGSSRFTGNWVFLNHHILNSSQYAVRDQLPLAGSCSNTLFEGADHQESAGSSTKQEKVSPQYPLSESRLLAYHDVGTIEKFLEGMSSISSSTDVSSNNFPGFPENLDFVEQ